MDAWGVIIVIFFILFIIGKFQEGYAGVNRTRKRKIEHQCWGEKYCNICGKEMRHPRT